MMVKITDSYLCHSAWVNQDHPCYWYTVRCHYSTVNFLTSIHRRHHIACPLRWGMGVSFVDSASDWYFASVPAIIYATSDYIGLPYNGTQLHMENIYPFYFEMVINVSLSKCDSKSLMLQPSRGKRYCLTHWGRVTHIYFSKLSINGSDNGLAPGWRQAIIWTNAGILFIWILGTSFNEMLIEIHTLSVKKMNL